MALLLKQLLHLPELIRVLISVGRLLPDITEKHPRILLWESGV